MRAVLGSDWTKIVVLIVGFAFWQAQLRADVSRVVDELERTNGQLANLQTAYYDLRLEMAQVTPDEWERELDHLEAWAIGQGYDPR